MFKRLKNQRGVVLIVVAMFMTYMGTMVIDMYESTLRNHTIAMNAKARLQSYYLAKSATRITKLVLYQALQQSSELQKQAETYANQTNQTGVDIDTTAGQILRQMYQEMKAKIQAFSKEGLETLVQMSGGSGEDSDEDSVTSTGDDSQDMVKSQLSMLSQDKVKEFLDFEGNFFMDFSEEHTKLSLNAVTKMTSTSDPTSYDNHKRILYKLLLGKSFKNYFKNQEQDAEALTHAIFDFADANGLINEFDKVERGNEASIYRNVNYEVKNAKYMTLSELRLIEGMGDDIYQLIEPYVTPYHTESTINVCYADDEKAEKMIDAMIWVYTNYAGCTSPIRETDKETLQELRNEVLNNCPTPENMAKALNIKLGLIEEEDESSTNSGTAATKSTSSKVSSCKFQFEDFLSDKNQIFTIKGIGEVNGVRTIITMVVDASSSKVSSWKIMYYQIQ